MNILLTGAAGFIGMHTTLKLLEQGHCVVGVDNFSPYYDVQLKQDRIGQLQPHPGFRFLEGDINDPTLRLRIEREFRPDRVVHLAAQVGVRHSLRQPMDYAAANLSGFLHVLEWCRHWQVQHLVYASSSSVYGGNRTYPFSEAQPVDHPISLYAATKKANELMAHSYSHLYQLPTTGLRFFTVYGPWGRPDMAAWGFTQAIAGRTPIEVFNHGDMIRDFTYIDDVVTSLVAVLERPATPNPHAEPAPDVSHAPYRVFNIGNAQPVRLGDFIHAIEKALGIQAIQIHKPIQPGDVPVTAADTRAVTTWTGITPHTPVERGVERFVNWFTRRYGLEAAPARAASISPCG